MLGFVFSSSTHASFHNQVQWHLSSQQGYQSLSLVNFVEYKCSTKALNVSFVSSSCSYTHTKKKIDRILIIDLMVSEKKKKKKSANRKALGSAHKHKTWVKHNAREDKGVDQEGVLDVVVKREGRNATNVCGQKMHPSLCGPSPLLTKSAPPPAVVCTTHACSMLLPSSVRATPLTLSLRNILVQVWAQRPNSFPPKHFAVDACTCGGGWGTQLKVIDSGVNLNEHSRKNGRMDNGHL
jgi:hypothetical protein